MKVKFCDIGQHEVTVLFHSRKANRQSCCPKCYRPEKSIVRKEKVSENGLNKAREVKKYVITKVSTKQAKINALYSVLRKQFLKDNPFCQVGKTNHLAFIWCNKKATSIHHAGSGSNKRKYYLDTTTWFSTCDYCHDVIHTLLSAEELYELGLKIRT